MMDLKPKPLTERVREYAQKCQDRADEATRMGMIYAPGWHQTEADNLREAADHIDALTEEVISQREALALWMGNNGYATGHGDTTADLLGELDWQHVNRVSALQAELEALKLALVGGEDVAGYAASRPAAEIIASHKQHERDLRAYYESLDAEVEAETDNLRSMLLHAREFVADALDAHEHSDGRNLLTSIDAALKGKDQ